MMPIPPGIAAYGAVHALASWLMTYVLHSIAIAAAALLVVRFLSMSAAFRVWIWRCAVVLPVVSATLVIALSDRSAAGWLDVTRFAAATHGINERAIEVDVRATVDGAGRRQMSVVSDDPLAERLALAVVVTACVGAVLSLAVTFGRKRRAVAALGPRHSAALAESVRHVVPRGIRVTTSSAPTLCTPVAITGREICVPSTGFFDLNIEQQRSVLLHEVAHLRRLDVQWSGAMDVLVAATWFQPLNRLLLSRMYTDAEQAADSHALRKGGNARALVESLAIYAARFDAASVEGVGVAFLRRRSPLEVRAEVLLQSSTRDRSPRQVFATAVGCGAVLAATARLLMWVPVPTTAPAPELTGGARGTPGAVIERDSVVRVVTPSEPRQR